MSTKNLGMYTQALVKVDFSRDLRYELTVERIEVCNKIEVACENLPKHCSFCHLVDHMLSECREALSTD